MSTSQQVTYSLDFDARRKSRNVKPATTEHRGPDVGCVPRIARLLALAIRLEGLLRDETIRDYAELARLGRVTRARMTQIMKLLDLAPDIQEQILFLPLIQGLNERNLRPIASRIDWGEQRRMFQTMVPMPPQSRRAARRDWHVPHANLNPTGVFLMNAGSSSNP
jgi:hypothetical protein